MGNLHILPCVSVLHVNWCDREQYVRWSSQHLQQAHPTPAASSQPSKQSYKTAALFVLEAREPQRRAVGWLWGAGPWVKPRRSLPCPCLNCCLAQAISTGGTVGMRMWHYGGSDDIHSSTMGIWMFNYIQCNNRKRFTPKDKDIWKEAYFRNCGSNRPLESDKIFS